MSKSSSFSAGKNPSAAHELSEKNYNAIASKIIQAYDPSKKGFLIRPQVYQLIWDSFADAGMGSAQLAKVPDIVDTIESCFKEGHVPYEALFYIIKPLVEIKLKTSS